MKKLLLAFATVAAVAAPVSAESGTSVFSYDSADINKTVEGVSLSYAIGTGTEEPEFYANWGINQVRLYQGNTMTFTAPEGTVISSITFEGYPDESLSDYGKFLGATASAGTLEIYPPAWSSGNDLVSTLVITPADDFRFKVVNVNWETSGERQPAGLAFSPETLTVHLGKNFTAPQLTNPNDLQVAWESSNTEVAAVGLDGTLTVKALGTATISAEFAGNDDFFRQTVSYELTVVTADPVLAFSSDECGVYLGEEAVFPTLDNPEGLELAWTSSDEAVATVENGTVTLVGLGTTVITASFAGNDEWNAAEASYTLTYSKPLPELSFEQEYYTALLSGEFNSPEINNPSNLELTWSSSDLDVATVDQAGVVTPVGKGSTVISASFAGNDEFGAVTVAYELEVTDQLPVLSATYDWTTKPAGVTDLVSDVVTVNFTQGEGDSTPSWNTVFKGIKLAKNNVMTISVPKGYVLEGFEMTVNGNYTNPFTDPVVSYGTFSDKVWSADGIPGNEVEFEFTGGYAARYIQTLTVQYRKSAQTAVEAIDSNEESAMPEYYDLQGRRVGEPTRGIYIVRQGSKVSKVAF